MLAVDAGRRRPKEVVDGSHPPRHSSRCPWYERGRIRTIVREPAPEEELEAPFQTLLESLRRRFHGYGIDCIPRIPPRFGRDWRLRRGERVLLTGGTGFLGGRLLPRLVEAGYQVTCLLRAKDERSAAARLRESLERRLNDRGVVESTLSNLTVLAGDIVRDKLGLFIKFLRAAKQSFGKTDRQGRVITPVRVIGNPDVTKNLVPVECVVRMIEAVFTRPQAHGRTYHITHENPPTLGLIWDVTLDLLGIVGAKLVGEESFALRLASVPERFFRQQMELYAPYLRHEPAFDKSNAGSTRWPRSGRSSSKATRSKNGPFRGKTALRGFYRGFYRTFASPSSRFLRVGSRFPTTILHNSPLDTPRS